MIKKMNYNCCDKSEYCLLECVIICVDYSDFLEITLEHNVHHFDRIVVVTSHTDKNTQDVCRKFSIDCVCTDVFYEGGNTFSKGLGINIGLGHLRCTGWVLHMDADVILPDNFRQMLRKSALKSCNIYGADRVSIIGRNQYNNLKNHTNFKIQHQYRFLLNVPSGLQQGARLIHNECGYAPIGYFQLWWGPLGRRYPTVQQDSAEHTDVMHALQWPRVNRILLPTIIVYHLESEPSKMGANWKGRTTKKF
jgi:Glycosyl transferase family 2